MVVLEGFHLVISVMVLVGYSMTGSGIKEIFSLIYAEESVDKRISRDLKKIL